MNKLEYDEMAVDASAKHGGSSFHSESYWPPLSKLQADGWHRTLGSTRAGHVVIHYLFVSQTAHLLALFAVFVGVGAKLGVSAPMLAFQLLFATNYFAALAPQSSSANLLFVGSGYLPQGALYKWGAIHTVACVVIYLVVGTPWLLLVAG